MEVEPNDLREERALANKDLGRVFAPEESRTRDETRSPRASHEERVHPPIARQESPDRQLALGYELARAPCSAPARGATFTERMESRQTRIVRVAELDQLVFDPLAAARDRSEVAQGPS